MAPRTLLLTCLAMIAFAGNSLLCRLALKHTDIDFASFTGLRLASGALMLWLLLALRRADGRPGGNAYSALALFLYAVTFSFAYLTLDAGTGALLLFGAVQMTMIGHGLYRGERFSRQGTLGVALALAGLVVLLLPGASAPPLMGALLMLLSGVAWGVYSLLGRRTPDPLASTAGNFLRATPLAALLAVALSARLRWDAAGALYAVLSGALASGVGYAIWYAALRGMGSLQAATVQLSVPILAALSGCLLLGEALTLRLIAVSAAVLGGIALVLGSRAR